MCPMVDHTIVTHFFCECKVNVNTEGFFARTFMVRASTICTQIFTFHSS